MYTRNFTQGHICFLTFFAFEEQKYCCISSILIYDSSNDTFPLFNNPPSASKALNQAISRTGSCFQLFKLSVFKLCLNKGSVKKDNPDDEEVFFLYLIK